MTKETQPVRNRIIGYRVIPRAQLVLHPRHHWKHPQAQETLLMEQADKQGNTSVLLVRQHPTEQDKYEILDGKLRFLKLPLEAFPCAICDLNDAEAECEAAEHNILGHMSVTDDPAIQAILAQAERMIPNPEEMLRELPEAEPQTQNDDKSPTEKQRKELKVQAPAKMIWLLCGIPTSEWGKVQPHIAALEENSAISVQKSGEPDD